MDNCIFCRIIKREIPAVFVHEDVQCVAFLDLHPIRDGHALIIPRQHIDHFSDVPDELAAHMMKVAQKLSRRMHEVLKPERVGLVVSGYGVPHAHLHVVPMMDEQDITSARYAVLQEGTLSFSMANIPIATLEERQAVAAKLR